MGIANGEILRLNLVFGVNVYAAMAYMSRFFLITVIIVIITYCNSKSLISLKSAFNPVQISYLFKAMPTTCGFPNCKFRSRYRGSDDIRHFYRVPKKPSHLRMKWLEAIGRTEETIVSQLRVCSGHFEGGEKKEGDVPVADPSTDKPMKVEIPPKIPRTSNQGRKKREKSAKLASQIIKTSKKSHSEKPKISINQSLSKLPSTDISFDSTLSIEKDNNFNSFMQNLLAPLIFSSPSTLNNPTSILPYAMRQLSNNDLLTTISSTLNIDKITSPISTSSRINEFKRQTLVIIDESAIDWTILEGIMRLSIFPTIEDAIFQNKDLAEADSLIIWDNCDLVKESILHMKNMRHIFKIGCGIGNIDNSLLKIRNIQLHEIISHSIDEVADNVMLSLLKFYRNGVGNTKSNFRFNDSFKYDKPFNVICQNVRQINSSCLGIIGGGPLSMAIANRAKVFGFNVMIFDSSICGEYKWNTGIESVETVEHILQNCDCIILNPSFNSVCDITEQVLLKLKPGNFMIDLNYKNYERNLSILSPYLRSNHIVGYIQNFDCKSTRPNCDFANFISVPLTQTLSPACMQKLRKSTAIEVQRCMKIEFNINKSASAEKYTKSSDEYIAPTTSVESGFFSIKSLADN